MKKNHLLLGAALLAAVFTSCKNDNAADENVDRYVVYVDSVERLDATERSANWDAIDAEYERRLAEADAAIKDMGDNEDVRTRMEETKTRYENVKSQAQSSANMNNGGNMANMTGAASPESLFGNSDTSFMWVNKDNIVGVYNQLYETYKSNADNYTKEQHEQIKQWYEALDERKNTVEKEGLTEEANEEIAKIKVKFAPLYKWEKLTADGPEDDK